MHLNKFWLYLAVCFVLPTFLISCGENDNHQDAQINTAVEVKKQKESLPDVADVSWKDGLTGKVFHNYLHMRTALVRSDADEVQTAAGNMVEAFSQERINTKSIANNIAQSQDLEVQRELFYELTRQLESMFKDVISEGTIYKQYCPMAFDNTGAFWFSDTPEIKNPYFGDKMLNCGKVIEEIK